MAVLAILRRDLNRYRRNPVRTVLLFLMPLVMAGIFTIVFGGGGVDQISIRILLWDEDDSLLSTLAEGAAGSSKADGQLDLVPVGAEGPAMMDRGEASALVHIPAGFTDDFLSGTPTVIDIVKNPSQRFLPQVVEEGAGVGAAVLTAASRSFRGELTQIKSMVDGQGFPTDLAVATLGSGMNNRFQTLESVLFPPVIGFETVTLTDETAEEESRGILAYFLPGLAVMGVFFLAQSATRDILRDRESGLLRHLLTAPVSPADYLAGKCLSALMVSSLGLSLLILFGVASGVSWGPPVAVSILALATAVAASGTLLLIMSLVGSERQGDALTTIVIISWSMLGGAFVPISQMPGFLKPISASTMVYWATDAFNTLALHDGGLGDIIFNISVLFGVGFAFLAGGAFILGRRIRRGAI